MRLIDADALVRIMCHHCTEYESCAVKDGTCDDFDMLIINHAPTIDPVRHGRWLVHTEKIHGKVTWTGVRCRWTGARCSLCDAIVEKRLAMYNYCPNCGARMDCEQ